LAGEKFYQETEFVDRLDIIADTHQNANRPMRRYCQRPSSDKSFLKFSQRKFCDELPATPFKLFPMFTPAMSGESPLPGTPARRMEAADTDGNWADHASVFHC
jgi:hypothetical protein